MPLWQLTDDRLLGALLARSRDEAGGLRRTGEGSMLGELVKAVLEEVRAWQARPLDPVYGEKHVLGIWVAKMAPGDGAGFWRAVMADLRNRGVRDILIACCDGLSGGFEDAIHATFERTVVQRFVVHLVRNAQRLVARRDARRDGEGTAEDLHRAGRGRRLRCPGGILGLALGPQVSAGREGLRGCLGGLHAVPGLQPGRRKLLNSIESLNYQLRKVTKARGHFPGDDAAVKLLWLAIINIEDKRARELAARRPETGMRSDQPVRLVEGLQEKNSKKV